jgi:hypothetical protein
VSNVPKLPLLAEPLPCNFKVLPFCSIQNTVFVYVWGGGGGKGFHLKRMPQPQPQLSKSHGSTEPTAHRPESLGVEHQWLHPLAPYP